MLKTLANSLTSDQSNADADGRISLLPRLTKTSAGRRLENGSIKVEAREPQGYFLSGPLCELPTGFYLLDLRCRVGAPNAPAFPVLGLEVVASLKGQQAWRDFTAEELAGGGGTVAFFVPPDRGDDATRFNFRLYHFGNSDLEITAVDLLDAPAPAEPPDELRRWRLLGRLRPRKAAWRNRDGAVTVGRGWRADCVLDGPSAFFLPQGSYELKLSCSTSVPKLPGQLVLGVDVISRERHRLAWRDFTAEELARGPATIDFVVPPRLGDHNGDYAPFSFTFLQLGSSRITVHAADLHELPAGRPNPVAPPTWRLLSRLHGTRWAIGAAVGRLAGTMRAPPRLHGLRPHLKLATGRYRLNLAGRAASRDDPARPAIGLDVMVQGVWRPPGVLRRLFEGLRWRLRRHIATLARCQFTGAELNAGECVVDFDVPSEWGIESGENVWFDIQATRLSAAVTHITDVRISGVAPDEDADRAAASAPSAIVSRRSSKKAVLVIGNCQAEVVVHELRIDPLSDRFSVNYHFVELPDHELEEGKRAVGNADIVLVQDISNWDNYPLREYISDTARIVKFPCLRFASLWPFDSCNGPGDPDAERRDWPQSRFPYLDGALARLRKETPDRVSRLTRYASLDLGNSVNPPRLHAFERKRLLAMDRQFQCEIGQFILDNFQSQRLFHTTTHPHGKLFVMVLRQLFKSIEIKDAVRSAEDIDSHFNKVQIPVHPLVATMLGVKWANEHARYLFEGEQMTWETYVRRYIDHYG